MYKYFLLVVSSVVLYGLVSCSNKDNGSTGKNETPADNQKSLPSLGKVANGDKEFVVRKVIFKWKNPAEHSFDLYIFPTDPNKEWVGHLMSGYLPAADEFKLPEPNWGEYPYSTIWFRKSELKPGEYIFKDDFNITFQNMCKEKGDFDSINNIKPKLVFKKLAVVVEGDSKFLEVDADYDSQREKDAPAIRKIWKLKAKVPIPAPPKPKK